MLLKLLGSFKVYNDRKFLLIFFLGLASGLPFNLIAAKATFGYWLSYSGVALSTVGLAGLICLPYSFKFIWAPLVDMYRIPFLSSRLGNKRAWALVFQSGLFLSILSLGFVNPAENMKAVLVIGTLVAFFSASQDIVIDALRVKILDDEQQGAGISATTVGYRVGLYLASGVALFIVPYVGWNNVYILAACASTVGMVTICYAPPGKDEIVGTAAGTGGRKTSFWEPFLEFTQRDYWLLFVLFIVFFRLGNSVLAVMAPPFYVDMGFSSQEVALISRTIGSAVTLLGGIIGGALIYKVKNIFKALFVIGFLEILTSLAFVVFAKIGYNIPLFAAVTVFDNIVGGIGGIFIISFLIKLCSSEYTTTQYAFLISLSSLSRDFVSSFSGFAAGYFGWVNFFVFDALLMVPGLLLLFWLYRLRLRTH